MTLFHMTPFRTQTGSISLLSEILIKVTQIPHSHDPVSHVNEALCMEQDTTHPITTTTHDGKQPNTSAYRVIINVTSRLPQLPSQGFSKYLFIKQL